ncbi:MAG: Fe-S cluster assembly protein IscX [Chloroflexota bacterium]|nr:Fe-S cluster assembly protein IscX [Chloroflexota bacterium]
MQHLYWESSYAIVLALMEAHSDVDVETVGTDQLFQWIVTLPTFNDDPLLAHEALLEQILREWYEEANAE